MEDADLQVAYYESYDESSRLDREPRGVLEKLRTRVVLGSVLAGSGTVLDIGGGAGVHAEWLARNGYEVQLFDPVQKHVSQAQAASAALPNGLRFSAERADARQIPRDDACADAVLLLGPLYHLLETEDRLESLTEAFRLLKPGGTLVAAGISRYAWLMDAYRKEAAHDPETQQSISHSVETGRSAATPTMGSFWAHFHEPSELRAEVESAGFEDLQSIALEGFAWMLPDLGDILESNSRREDLMRQLSAVESAPSLIGASAHFVVTGTKP